MIMPTLFISHGAPTLALEDSAARRFLAALGKTLPRPRAIVIASAHWEMAVPSLTAGAVNATIHDFHGFPAALQAMRYPAPGAPLLAARAAALLQDAGYPAQTDPGRGLDHGAWVPLALMYPAADIPVLELSIQPHRGPAHHLAVGRALAPLREEGVLIMGSGGLTHDLARFRGQPVDAAVPPDVDAFADWMADALLNDREADLLAYRTRAPHAVANHPTEEHLLPLFVARGAAGEKGHARRLHASSTYGILRMDAYVFEAGDAAAAAA